MKQLPEQEQPRSLDAWLSYLEKLHSQEIDLGLERIRQVAAHLALLQPEATVITVAGTNGKGSSVAFLSAMLQEAGYRVGCFTSPHLVDYRERVQINGQLLPEQEHCAAFAAINAARGDISLTYFEFGTLAALWLLQKHQVDIAVLEVGLGGRLDAVNIIDPELSIVTSVGIDHIDYLGRDRENIGFEKAGIYRSQRPAICGDAQPPQRLLAHAEAIQAQLLCVEQDYGLERLANGRWHFQVKSARAAKYLTPLTNLPEPQLPVMNALGVIAGLQLAGFNLSREQVCAGLEKAQVAGRFEIIANKPLTILDVAHNPQAAQYLRKKVSQLLERKIAQKTTQQAEVKTSKIRVIAVCGMLNDKDIQATLAELTGLVDVWYLADLPGPRGAKAAELSQALGAETVPQQNFSCVTVAYENAQKDAGEQDIIICFGSFLTIAALYAVQGRKINGE